MCLGGKNTKDLKKKKKSVFNGGDQASPFLRSRGNEEIFQLNVCK